MPRCRLASVCETLYARRTHVGRNVKGVLFSDYVRMIRREKQVDWANVLVPEDLRYVASTIDPDAWYPMETFERLGNAILHHVAGDDVEIVRAFGRFSVAQLHRAQRQLVADDDPVETLMRFRVLRATYFDFDALAIPTLVEDHAEILVRYQMGPTAEEAASHQTMGFFEGLLEVAGATDVRARFTARSWAGDPITRVALEWTPPSPRVR